MAKKKKGRIGVVYSTDPDFEYRQENQEEEETLSAENQNLKVFLDRKQRKGKSVTIIENFIGTEEDLKALGKTLKTKCGVGGSVKDGQIIIQGDLRKKVADILRSEHFNVKVHGM